MLTFGGEASLRNDCGLPIKKSNDSVVYQLNYDFFFLEDIQKMFNDVDDFSKLGRDFVEVFLNLVIGNISTNVQPSSSVYHYFVAGYYT